jgi:hypothetical protein
MDWANWSTARKILLPASLLLLIDSFLTWNQVCGSFGGKSICVPGSGFNAWHGIGFLMGILVLVLLVWELIDAFAPDTISNMNLPVGIVGAGLALATAVFAVIRFLEYGDRKIWAWVGLVLGLVIAYGGWLRFQESGGKMPTRASMSGGGAGTTAPPPTTPAPPEPPVSGGMGTTTPAPPPPPPAAGGDMGGGAGMGGSSGSPEDTPPA